MGIRFFCPNGHKLHVKAFLAGKRGYCPKCGTKLLIPEASADALSKKEAAGKTQSADLLPRSAEDRQANPIADGEPGAAEDDFAQHAEEIRVESERFDEAAAQRQSMERMEPRGLANDAVWYVRPPSGGQYGPATQEEFERWQDEGRIPSESLVWREGWEDWRTAAEAGTQLATDPGADKRFAVDQDKPAAGTNWSYQENRKRKRTLAVVLLGLACLALLVVFLLVLRPSFGG